MVNDCWIYLIGFGLRSDSEVFYDVAIVDESSSSCMRDMQVANRRFGGTVFYAMMVEEGAGCLTIRISTIVLCFIYVKYIFIFLRSANV